MNIVKKITHAVINKIRPLIFSYVFVSITIWMHLDIDGTGGAFMNQRFTSYPPVINHNLGWCNYDLDICCHIASLSHNGLTHWGRVKMAAIFADDIFICIFLNKSFWISYKISLEYVPYGVIDNEPSLVEIMGCRRMGDKPLSQPMIYWRMYASLGLDELKNTWIKRPMGCMVAGSYWFAH